MSAETQNAPDPSHPNREKQSRRRRLTGYLEEHERIFNVLNTTITAIFTIILASSTVLLWKETKDLRDFAQEQSEDMKASIPEAARSAAAMQDVAKAVANSAKAANESTTLFREANVRQMRAYVTVGLGGVVRQDTKTNYHFEVRMVLQNLGNTPAYNVRTVSRAGIFDFPPPKNFPFPMIDATVPKGAVVGPHQNYIITAFADKLYSDEDINEVEYGSKKRLYVYGAITYEDAFGIKRHTNFCQVILYLKNNGFMSQNSVKYNDSD
ncbi:MAG TPA: hypothetical protein VGV41_09140 [Pseudolabrys sp.]|uniref:hypothetical protein n=1 Tax=Pseudolabrys sp. TaxID=1960880 RepID=UPI002DDCE780|nr:hypothetical protein [Pseudolabrys sp.]HEV2628794.1 hypothetical protein [Pseudolabrys sp.]